MKVLATFIVVMLMLVGVAGATGALGTKPGDRAAGLRALPAPVLAGHMSLEEAIARRRSQRRFTDQAITVAQMAQLCWAGQGITDPDRGLRASPSAGALYPMELYVVTADGVDHYRPTEHALELSLIHI